ncbi:unnamed protein product [Schistocephalus solidus]|uniref:P/Homo B domain-containing protein n=1 Tax=Schistocephalus solidus TaxID=70667 RepID=A0A183SEX4_SCHSO|nr:unnamed protein product [Schistocephalus solidus]
MKLFFYRSLRGLFAEVYALNFTGCRPRPSSWPGDRIDEEGEPVVFLEHVQLFLNIAYGHRGLLRIVLQSPSGTQSEIMPTRSSDAFSEVYGLDRWPLMSVQFWGEPAAGEWLIRIDNQQGYSQLPRWQKDQLTLNSTTARWESAYIVSYGTSSFPIRLRPPNPLRPPPQLMDWWFASAHLGLPWASLLLLLLLLTLLLRLLQARLERFKKQMRAAFFLNLGSGVENAKKFVDKDPSVWLSSGFISSLSSSRPSPLSGLGRERCALRSMVRSGSNPSPNTSQKTPPPYRDRSFQCLAECPPATTTLVSFLIHNISGGVHAPGAAPALLCERCWVTCAECLRPHSSIDCIQCFGDSFLLPLLTPGDSPGLAPELAARLPNHALTDRLLVGSCVASCPVGYLANMATRICEPCPENCARCSGTRTTQCLICASGFRLVNGSCLHVATPEGRCLEGQFFQEGDCFDCPVGCASSSCSQDGACTYCSNTHRFMHRGACLPACPQGYFASQILSPQGLFLPTLPYESLNYTSTVWHCSPCPPGCTECLPSAKISSGYILPRCTACETPLQLDVPTGLCKSHCRLGDYDAVDAGASWVAEPSHWLAWALLPMLVAVVITEIALRPYGCLTWASIGGGFLVEAPLSSSTGSGEAANISWSWLTEYPSRITLFVLCLVFLFAALGFIVYQVSIARCWRRQRHALSAMSMTRPCSSASRLSQHSPTAAGSPVLRINGHANGRITTAAMASENGEGDRLNPKYSKPESSLDQGNNGCHFPNASPDTQIFRQPQSSPSAWTRSRSQKGTPQGSAKYYSVWYRRINQSESSDSDRNEQDLAMVAQTADPTGQPLG